MSSELYYAIWDNEILKNWSKSRMKNITEVLPKSCFEAGEGNEEGKYPFYTSSQELSKRIDTAIYNGNAITMATGGNASVNYVDSKFSTSTDCFNFKTNQHTKFIAYYLFAIKNEIINNLWFEGIGIRHLQKNKLMQSHIYLPPISEQYRIAEYLDKKTESIDSIIKDLNKQVELLYDIKKSIINKAVINGITSGSSATKLKIGRVVDLKQGLAINAQSSHLMTEEITSLPLLRIADMNTGTKEYFLKETTPKQYLAHEEDIIYSRTGQVGLVFKNQFGVVHNNCFRVIPKDETIISRDFLYWVLKSDYFYNYANMLAFGSAQPDLSHHSFKSIVVSLFSIEEQKTIVSYLDKKCEEIDKISADKIEQIKKLEDYKQSLIFEYVTGKKRVKEAM